MERKFRKFEDNEFEGVELSERIKEVENCKHEYEFHSQHEYTADGRERKKEYMYCKKCFNFVILKVEEEPVSEEAIWI